MTRAFVFVAAIAALAPAQAFACGMYIPDEDEKMLAQVFDEIDAVVPVVAVPSVEKNAANAAALVAEAAPPVIAEAAAEKPES